MPPKRKRTDPHPKPPAPSTPGAPRRSSRRLKINNTSDPAPVTLPSPEHGETLWDTKEGVEKAMRDLSEMEYKLQSAVRKQRLAVESSDLSVEGEEAGQVDLKPSMKSSKALLSELVIDTTGPEHLAQALPDDHETDFANRDVESARADQAAADRGANRPPAVNSDRLPLPWRGRLGYACLNTYLRSANPTVFSSRTCRIGSIIEHRHPLQDPSQPEHATKNRPDRNQPPDDKLGRKYVEALGLANAKDIPKMLRWNHKYGINFMRLSSEMFPFASHQDHGYKLSPFASAALAEAGKVAAELSHRVTMHPGQFTQIASPRKEVVEASFRDLEYHDELLTLLKLPEQMNRDAVMILHMGGTYGDKASTLDRFRKNYIRLSDSIKRRLVLENDDVAWSVHDLLPICEELNIPLVLDFHHHNIIFDPSMREGTLDIIQIFDRIKKTWTRKGIRQKMHYSESVAGATTPRDRRKHSARVKTLPPCDPDMDLMIEAKDKEQAVFDLMKTFRLPGHEKIHDLIPFEREDESRKAEKKKVKKGKKKTDDSTNGADEDTEIPERVVAEEDRGMGGPLSRVYWPEGMEEWLKPKKKENKKVVKTED